MSNQVGKREKKGLTVKQKIQIRMRHITDNNRSIRLPIASLLFVSIITYVLTNPHL